ncbi:MAG TPA: hypothetical protein VGB76_03320 [Pyrinomonadaceae bacterium]|jgi:hypothetical protein
MSSNQSDNSQGDTGTRDISYDLLSISYHLLQGAETLALYIADARQEGNDELVQFFQETKDEFTRRAERSKALLVQYVGQEQAQAASGS